MKILFAASEGVPFCKTGGLADIAGALPEALAAKRHAVRLILPFYRQIRDRFPKIKFIGRTIQVPFDGKKEPVQIWQLDPRPNYRVYFVDAPIFFDRPGIYGPQPATAYPDNDRRYAFFSKAVLELTKAVDFRPDILHGHDWQTGLVMAYLKLNYALDPFFSKTASVFSIHNMAYQGNFPAPSFHMTGLPPHVYNIKGVEFYGNVSFMKAALIYADALNTVSPTYAKEIMTDPVFGCGMEGILRDRAADFQGILNGLDVKFWDPNADRNIVQTFDEERIDKRALCKADLQKEAGFPVDALVPLLAFIGRLDHQKGIDLLIETLPTFLKEGVQFICLGQGNPQYVKDLGELARRFPNKVYSRTDFSEPFAHKIYAGADIFLMPSRFEPCGLGQMIAMRYGAIPVVTPTGGLLDTVIDNGGEIQGTGFVANDLKSTEYLAAIRRALDLHKDKRQWVELQKRAMHQDFSWKASIRDYLLLYESLLK